MKLKKYGKYRQSGVEWLGEVPEGWNVKRLKHVTSTISKGTTPSTEGLEVIDEGTIRFLKAENLVNNSLSPEPRFFIDEKTNSSLSRSILQEKDVLLVIAGATIGKVAILEKEFVPANTNQAVCFVRLARKEQSQFVWHYFQSEFVRNQILVNLVQSAQPNISMSLIKELVLPLPPSAAEQSLISSFLDRETGRIDALISKKQRLIELLKEKRSALISRAVTKGLNPKVKTKPSGVEWLGEVPEHWEVKALRYLFVNLDNKRVPLSAEERGDLEKIYPYYGASGIIDYVDRYIYDEPLILIAEDGANLLSRSTPLAFRAEGKYWVNNHAHILRPKYPAIMYWECLLQLFDYTPFVSGSAQPKLTSDNLGSILLPVPPLPEQNLISSFLDRETSKLDALISKVEQAIVTLKEYRTALISAAVTGKIKVKDEVGRMKDE